MSICDFGCGQISIKTFKTGRNCCSKSASSCPAMKEKNSEKVKKIRNLKGDQYWKNGHPKGSANGTSLKGKSWEEIYKDRAEIERNKRSESLKGNKIWQNLSEQQKKDLADNARQQIVKRYESGWMPRAGRCKKYKYVSPTAGEVRLDGSWELAVAKWLDSQGYNWKRNTRRFQYINLKGSISFYIPDFWVDEFSAYLEVKGYETELDRCKWKQFTENLIVWKKEELRNIGAIP